MFKAQTILTVALFILPNFAAAFTPGEILKEEVVTLIGPGLPDKGYCADDEIVESFKLDSGYTRTGSMEIERSNGERMVVNLSVSLTKVAGYDEPIDPGLNALSKRLCSDLVSLTGKKISVRIQKLYEEDEGQTLETHYLRQLKAKGAQDFINNSDVYAPLP